MGINPLPARRSAPIWIGGMAEVALRRAGRVADGWFPLDVPPDAAVGGMVERLRQYAGEAFLTLGAMPENRWAGHAAAWRAIGGGFATVDGHIAALERAEAVLAGRAPPPPETTTTRLGPSRYCDTTSG
jgi:alkanesulfonate monooxygenase SsuD/methylene tetrahydromethanopterin reductase-like flavin-dependent oxidoreductase (luciferase family)